LCKDREDCEIDLYSHASAPYSYGVSDIIQKLLEGAFASGATDVFLTEGERPRMRYNGAVYAAGEELVTRGQMMDVWYQCGYAPEATLEADGSYDLSPRLRLRVNLFHTLGRMSVVMRPIRNQVPGFDELNLPGELLQGWLARDSGLILISGPTGAGKSTTLASCLDWINQHQSKHIVTIEDPVEYLFENKHSWFSQREVGRDTDAFPVALRSALRQSPDVIMIGEIRDVDTATTALRAAETGQLVLSTLHCSGVADSLDRVRRLLDPGKNPGIEALLSQQLIGLMSQRLLPRVDGHLQVVLEYFENQGATRKWIAEGSHKELYDYICRAPHEVASPFLRYLIAGVEQGVLEPAVARSAADRPQDFDRAMRGITQ
jgi:pilus retraction protein PilT